MSRFQGLVLPPALVDAAQQIADPLMLGHQAIMGLPYYVHPFREQFRFPRSRKKRIRKKWRKDPRNWREVRDKVIMFNPLPAFAIS